ncbi:co-chaperone YbbN [Myroides sp. N17-2]|uniref:thioredoxin family protein n=1 Tax=Myroides sp. N17-2 TaxID=2030799 RepID=UPI000EFCB98E|nr:thioredoxin family protein [Myroides sp. N17-2]
MEEFIDFDNLKRPVLVQFYADWCSPCKTLSGIIDHIEADIEAEVDLIRADIDQAKELKEEFFVRSVPTMILLNKQGDIYWRQTGVVSPEEIMKHVWNVDKE